MNQIQHWANMLAIVMLVCGIGGLIVGILFKKPKKGRGKKKTTNKRQKPNQK